MDYILVEIKAWEMLASRLNDLMNKIEALSEMNEGGQK